MSDTKLSTRNRKVKMLVFGMLLRGSNTVRLFPVENRSAKTLLAIIAENVESQSTIVLDGWAAYGGINAMQQQFNHQWVNHRLNFVDPNDPTIHTQDIEGTRYLDCY
jgi:transposase-like protein